MKKQYTLIAMLVIVSMLVFAGCSTSSSLFGADSGDDNTVTLTAENAEDGSSATGSIVLEDGQELQGLPELSEEGTIRIDIYAGNLGPEDLESAEVLASMMLSGTQAQAVELEAGEYTLLAEGEGTVTGSAKLQAGAAGSL